MIGDILSARALEYRPANSLEQERILAELLQHYVLASLARAKLFSHACFRGGSYLRICHGLQRFSEDLDFLLRQPDPSFKWAPYLERIVQDARAEGLDFEAQDRSRAAPAVKKAFLKTDSIGTVLTVSLPFRRTSERKIRIKLEVDSNPPLGSSFETKYLDFPMLTPITTQTLSSSFACKAHALLCRDYVKGRDWYDFLWYVSRKVTPDYELLGNALRQQGPWAGKSLVVSRSWFLEALEKQIESIDWNVARKDVERFLVARESGTLVHWDRALFLHHLEKLAEFTN